MLRFQDKVALITGSGTGIGMTVAKKFVENGASVIILGRRREPLEETAKMLESIITEKQSNGFVKIYSGVDVSDETSINNMFDDLSKSNTNVDVIVNNAGVSGPVTCFSHADYNDFKSTVGIHLTGTFWTSVSALKVLKEGSKIVTISTFFTEERPLEQRPYRFRSPYTASQGAKNRLAELMSWELVDKGIVSIATNPGPVHSDRIYKTVYPKAAAEFLRVSGFEDLSPTEVESVAKDVLPLLGEEEDTIKEGISKAASNLAQQKGITDEDETKKLEEVIAKLLSKIQGIAEKVQSNTSKMIADEQFLSQSQVADTVLTLSEDSTAKTLNGKVIPGDRVFYPVKSHVSSTVPANHQKKFDDQVVVFTVDATTQSEVDRVIAIASNIEENGGKAVCFVSQDMPKEMQEAITGKFHAHAINLSEKSEIERWLNTAKTKVGNISMVIHSTGNVPQISKFTELSRSEWDKLVDKFINIPAAVGQSALGVFVPGGSEDPRLFKESNGRIIIIGPDLPSGKKISGNERAKVEVFRGALRPFTTTVNQEFSDVLKSNIRSFLVLPGSVDGKVPDDKKAVEAINFFAGDLSAGHSEVIYCPDEARA